MIASNLNCIQSRRKHRRSFLSAWFALLVSIALALSSTAAVAGVPEDIKTLIEQGRSAEAYALGLQHEDMLGQPLFDYYFGIAAVEAGRMTVGVLALERFMLQDPTNDLARLELGRAYYLIGDYARAVREFDAVLAKSPPLSVQITIRRLIASMRDRNSRAISGSLFGRWLWLDQ